MRTLPIIAALAIVAIFTRCTNEPSTTDTTATDTAAQNVAVPDFNRDSALMFVSKQVDFGPRRPNSTGHVACKKWLVAQLKGYGAEVIEQNFDAKAYTGEVLKSTNIIGQFNPAATRRIILAAHWDTRHIADQDADPANKKKPILGADDGGSGVGVLLEVARQMQIKQPDLGVDIILFDAEDFGNDGGNDASSWCLGSQYWAHNPHKPGYHAMYGILLDMVGGAGAHFGKEAVSVQFASTTLDMVWKVGRGLGYDTYFTNDMLSGITDDHLAVNEVAHIPMIDIINRPDGQGFPAHWHTQNDNIKAIDQNTLKAVGQTLLAVIYREAAGVL